MRKLGGHGSAWILKGGEEELVRTKRAQANGQPFDLYLEVLVVTDYTIFVDHKEYAQTDDVSLVFLYMRTYFAHYINGVSGDS